jgi:hypothetical protein
MLDTKTSCLLRGITGVIFGFLALMIPEPVIFTFSGLFLVLIGLCIALFLFLAITSRGDESMLWFGFSAVLLVIAILSGIFAWFVGMLFIIIIAAIAAYNGFYDLTYAMTHPKTKYIVIPAMVLTAVALLCFFYLYFPNFGKHLDLSIVGTLAFTFGLFSIGMGYYQPEIAEEEEAPVEQVKRIFRWPEGKQ